MTQVGRDHGPSRFVVAVLKLKRDAPSVLAGGPRFRLELNCGHFVPRFLVRRCARARCDSCKRRARARALAAGADPEATS